MMRTDIKHARSDNENLLLIFESIITKKIRKLRPRNGAGRGNRTHDLCVTNALLYQLSYSGLKF